MPLLQIAACSYEGSIFGWDIVPSTPPDSTTSIGNDDSSTVGLNCDLKYGFNTNTNSVSTGVSLKAIAVSGIKYYAIY
jgi:hypothetical protein